MKNYEKYLWDESEEFASQMKKELAEQIDENLSVVANNLTEEEKAENSRQVDIVESIYCTIVKLLQLENVEMGTWSCFSFSTVIETVGNKQTLTESPRLSREKLKGLKIHELSELLIELFLDRDNWSKEIKYSTVLSDGNGNWLI